VIEHLPVSDIAATELLDLTDAYLREFEASVVALDAARHAVALDRTLFSPPAAGSPTTRASSNAPSARPPSSRSGRAKAASRGTRWRPNAACRKSEPWCTASTTGRGRRHLVMRLHLAQHVMNGIVWRDHRAHVTGAQITRPEARLDFELGAISQEFARSLRRRSTRSSQ
jgi:misacylated tRNA(Ala) deacylase